MTLPDRRPATTTGQPAYQSQPISGTVQPYAPMHVEPVPVAYVPDPYNPGMSVAVDARLLQPPVIYQPRDLTPQPVLDPVAQRLLGAGLGGGALAAGAGWGVSEIIGSLAGISTGTLIAAGFLVAAVKIPAALARRPRVTNETHVTNNNRWLGRSTTNTHQR